MSSHQHQRPVPSSRATEPSYFRRVGVLLVLALVAAGLSALVSPAASAVTPEPSTPWVQSDKGDYPPGGLVQLSGGDWQPGEAVHVYVNDDQGRTWERHSDVVADETGAIADSFNLPEWFVATYKVLATGELSGTATTGFTDGNVEWRTDPAGAASITATRYDDEGCTGGVRSTITGNGGSQGVGNGSMLFQVPATSGSRTFIAWAVTSTNGYEVRGDGTSVCVDAPTGSALATARYTAGVTTTTLAALAASGTYGGTTNLSATLKTAGGLAIAGRDVSFSLAGTGVGTATTNASGVATLTGVSLGGRNAGTYTGLIGASFAGDASHSASNTTADLTVNKAPLTISADNKNKTYGEPNPALTFSVSGLVAGDTEATALTGAPTLSTAAATAGAGVHAINVTGGTSPNYTLSYNAGTLTVGKAVLTVTADDKGRAYGQANPTLTSSVSGLVNDDSRASALPAEPTLATTAAASSPTGTYPITLTGGTTSANYTLALQNGTLTVAARAITVTADAKSKTYGDADPDLTYTITAGELVGNDELSGALTREAGQNVGTYAIEKGTLSAGSNYAVSYVGADLTINPKSIAVTADARSKTYGDADPDLTYQITAGSLAYSDAFTGALDRVNGQDIGTYAIGQGTLALSANYDLTYVGATFTITKRNVTVTADPDQGKTYGDADPALTYKITAGSLAYTDAFTGALDRANGQDVGTYAIGQGTLTLSANYNLSYAGRNFTIDKRHVTVTADPGQGKTYGEMDPGLTYSITTGSLAYNDAFTGALDRANGQDVGTYAIGQGTLALSTNYNLSYVGGNFTIAARAITVTADAGQNKIYGQDDPALTYTVTLGTLASGDELSGSLGRVAGQDVGTYAIEQGNLSAGSNYDLTYVGDTFTITKRAITATADPGQGKTYGNTDPTLTYSITTGSLAYNDAFTGALDRANGQDVGTYAIGQGTLALTTNYDLTYVDRSFTIAPRAITVTADPSQGKTYGEIDPDLTYSITTGSLAYNDAFTGALDRANGQDVGTYAIGQGTLALSTNYNLSYVGGNFTIDKRNVTVTADAGQGKTYGNSDPALTYAITTGSLAYQDDFTGTLTRVAGQGVGAYAILQGTLALNSNYNLTYVGADFTVDKRQVTVTADAGQGKTYGDNDPALTYSITAGSLAYSDAFTGALDRANGQDVGTYAIGQGTLALSANYDLTFVGDDFTINKASLTVTARDETKIVGAPNPAFSATVTGNKYTDTFTVTFTTAATTSSPVGTYDIVPSITGAAIGNYEVTTVKGKLRVFYGWNGFLQPINDTAHEVTATQSKFRLGQTIPAKFVIKDAAGNVVQQSSNPTFSVSGNRGQCDSSTVAESLPTIAPEAGRQYAWTGSHYQYNWSTKGLSSGEYRLWAHLADGSTVSYVDICLTK